MIRLVPIALMMLLVLSGWALTVVPGGAAAANSTYETVLVGTGSGTAMRGNANPILISEVAGC